MFFALMEPSPARRCRWTAQGVVEGVVGLDFYFCPMAAIPDNGKNNIL